MSRSDPPGFSVNCLASSETTINGTGFVVCAVCGPPVVYKFILQRLLDLGFPKNRILMSLERRMKCGIGKCGHCSIGYKYTCLQGPIFTYWDAINLPEMI